MENIAKAFVKAQKEFGTAHKTSNNPFFKSKYADLSVVIAAVLDSLNNNGIALIQNCHESDTGVIVETIFLHESGETISCGRLSVPAAKNDPQGYGSALTYGRRYSLMAACGIAPEDDDGNAATKAVKEKVVEIDTKGAEDILETAVEFGTETLKKAWGQLAEPVRIALKDKLAGYKDSAAKNDNK
jgi:hypothetical protein